MKLRLHSVALLLGVCSLVAQPASAAPGPKIREKAQISVVIDLQPTADAPAGAAVSAEIKAKRLNGVEAAKLKVKTSGLPAGTYSITAEKPDLTAVLVGSFAVSGAVVVEPGDGDAVEEEVEVAFPSGLLALEVANLSVSDEAGTVLFSGEALSPTTSWKYAANVRVTAPITEAAAAVTDAKGRGGSKPKRVHGHVVVRSTIADGVETQRHFLWVAFGAPAEMELTINVDGQPVGTVTSTHKGKVKFSDLPEVTLLPALRAITLTDSTGAVVMEATF